ncbi:glucosaminidase domain-containing protein [bacterium]|nr:glucosaminidase domain-containing protein [bacterium]
MKRYSAFISLLLLFLWSGNLCADVFLSTYEEIKSAYDLVGYTWDNEKIPRIFVKKIPEEIKKIEGVERRQFFIKLLLPLVLLENEKITAEHDRIVPIAAKKEWNAEDVKIISGIAEKYNIIDEGQDISAITEDEKEKIRYFLDHKIRPVPPAIAIGQAALESGWGTSRFVFEGNNLFGHVSPDPTKGIKPKNWSGNQRHIRIFDSIQDSISAYMLNLNRNRAYNKFRWYRRTHPDNLSKMAEGFDKYAIIKEAYVGRLQSVMFKFGVHKINNAKLDSGESANVIEKVSQPYIN